MISHVRGKLFELGIVPALVLRWVKLVSAREETINKVKSNAVHRNIKKTAISDIRHQEFQQRYLFLVNVFSRFTL